MIMIAATFSISVAGSLFYSGSDLSLNTTGVNSPNVGATYRYKGRIGTNRVTFEYQFAVYQGEVYDEELFYCYDNVGKNISLRRTGKNGRYTVFKEYVNGRHTGTFTIIITPQSITGSFVNYRGQTFNVSASVVSHR